MELSKPTRTDRSATKVRSPSPDSVVPAGDGAQESTCHVICRYVITGLRHFVAFMVSHVGLTCAVVGYSILGGLMFQALELPSEQDLRTAVTMAKDRVVDRILDYVNESEADRVFHKPRWDGHMDHLLREFEQEIFHFTQNQNWDGRYGNDPFQWTFADALLYSVTVITTIGYGNITPKTVGGRLITIIYGVIGIPLTMLCLTNIGNILAGCFRLVYRFTCVNMTYHYIRLKRKRLRTKFAKRFQSKTKHFKNWARRKQSSLMSTVMSSIHASNASLGPSRIFERRVDKIETIEEGDGFIDINSQDMQETDDTTKVTRSHSVGVVPGDSKTKQTRRVTIAEITPLTLKGNKSGFYGRKKLSRRMSTNVSHPTDLAVISEDCVLTKEMSQQSDLEDDTGTHESGSVLKLDDFDEDERILKQRLKTTRDLVPISVCLLLVFGYIILGAIIFVPLEEGWTFLVGIYFCFITLTTIGFGDFVPGMGKLQSDEKRVICVVYLVLGMSLLAMSFHLIQEEVRYKCRKLAIKMGLIQEKLTQMLDSYDKDEDPKEPGEEELKETQKKV